MRPAVDTNAIDLSELRAVAGEAYWQRGEAYFARALARLESADASSARAVVQGSHAYRVQLRADDVGCITEYGCDCPLGIDGEACKHVVAAALAWASTTAGNETPPPKPDDLATFLGKQSKKQLLAWLLKYTNDFPELRDALEFRMQASAATDTKSLRKALSRVIGRPRFMDWRESDEYALKVGEITGLLEDLLESDPVVCFDGCEYGLTRLLKVYPRTDDSSGMINEAITSLTALHARAAAQSAGDKALARSLFKRQADDEWGFFPLDAYWATLGDNGQAIYGQLIAREYDALPEQPAKLRDLGSVGGDYVAWAAELSVRRRMESYAKVSGDIDLLLRVLQRDLSYPRAYEQLVDACREAGRNREAQNWAENGLRQFPDDISLRTLLAEELQRVGLDEEALELHWQNFEARLDEDRWLALKAAAGDAWPTWRKKALALAEHNDSNPARGPVTVSLQVVLLMVDGDLAAAVELARGQLCEHNTLQTLAARAAGQWPDDAAVFYRRCVDIGLQQADAKTYKRWLTPMKKAAGLMSEAERHDWLSGIRATYKRRPKLMALMDKAGL